MLVTFLAVAARADGWRAFEEMASVLTGPRCINCHVPDDAPLQGDELRRHDMNVKRGGDGRGTPALHCSTCHQIENTDVAHAPPGAKDWRLPPPKSRMAWLGLTPSALCESLKDPARNGGRSLAALEEHLRNDAIVNWGVEPGAGPPAAAAHARRAPRPLRRMESSRCAVRADGEHAMNLGMTRRDWLKASAIAGGGLVLAANVPALAGAAPAPEANLNAWLRIGADNEVTIVVSQAEMGQGISTTLPAVLAEELGADWSHVKLVTSPAHHDYRNPRINWQFTGNSESTSSFFALMRKMGAAAREMLIAAAAARWKVAPESCHADKSRVVHGASGRTLRFGDVAAAAAQLAPPDDPPLKPRSEWKLLGRSLPRVDNPGKIDGSAAFGLDFVVPGMVYAAVKASPTFGGKVKRMDAASVTSRPGVIAAVPIPDGVAVVAKSFWAAKKALDALEVEFDDGPNAALGHDDVMKIYRDAMASDEGWVLAHPGAAAAPPAPSVTAEYESQFLAHATMEPMNCTARVENGRCEVWAPTQGQELAQIVACQVLGFPPESVSINRTFLGGGFGRRLLADFVAQAIVVAKAVGRPGEGHLDPRGGHPARLLPARGPARAPRLVRRSRRARRDRAPAGLAVDPPPRVAAVGDRHHGSELPRGSR